MSLLCVAGATSRAGKTALAAALLRAFEGRAAAVKFTTTEDVFERCPRGTPCVVCDIDVPYRLVTEDEILRQAGTDTDRLAAAGARRVVWAIAKQACVGEAWGRVSALVGPGPVVMEGSTIAPVAKPDLLLFVVHPFLSPSRWKATSDGLLTSADVVVVNRPNSEPREPSTEVLDAIAACRRAGDVRVADVTTPLDAWAPDVLKRALAGASAH